MAFAAIKHDACARVLRMGMVVGAVLLVASFFLPYLSATPEYRSSLDALSSSASSLGVSVPSDQMADISLFSMMQLFTGDQIPGLATGVAAIYIGFFGSQAVLAVITLILALCGRPIGTAIFGIMAGGLSGSMFTSLLAQGAADGQAYTWGIGSWMYLVGAAVVIVCSVALAIRKHSLKKAAQKDSTGTSNADPVDVQVS